MKIDVWMVMTGERDMNISQYGDSRNNNIGLDGSRKLDDDLKLDASHKLYIQVAQVGRWQRRQHVRASRVCKDYDYADRNLNLWCVNNAIDLTVIGSGATHVLADYLL